MLNSCYGSLANKYFRWYDLTNAEAITTSGQLSIRWAEQRVNSALNKILNTDTDYIIAVDTDSLYVRMDKFLEKFHAPDLTKEDKLVSILDKAAEELERAVIKPAYRDLARTMNAHDQKMRMKRENIGSRALWCLHPDSEVSINGRMIKIRDYYTDNEEAGNGGIVDVGSSNDLVASYDIAAQRETKDRVDLVLRKWYEGDMYQLTFEGKTVHVTADHSILTRNKQTGEFDVWKRACDLTEDDELLLFSV